MVKTLNVYDARTVYLNHGNPIDAEMYETTKLTDLTQAQLVVEDEWTVVGVLRAAGYSGTNGFSFVTPEIERDLFVRSDDLTWAHLSLIGLNERGVAHFRSASDLTWGDFLRAADAGFYQGDQHRIVVWEGGAGGGPPTDGLAEVVNWLFGPDALIVKGAASITAVGLATKALAGLRSGISNVHTRRITYRWRKQGFTGDGIREYLGKLPQWDEQHFATQMQLTPTEAQVALTRSGYKCDEDGLWRLGESETATRYAAGLVEIQQQAEHGPGNTWSEDLTDTDETNPPDEPQR